jgi:hypothetical protein
MMSGQSSGYGTSQIVADPDCRARSKVIVEFDHVLDDLPQSVRLRNNRCG